MAGSQDDRYNSRYSATSTDTLLEDQSTVTTLAAAEFIMVTGGKITLANLQDEALTSNWNAGSFSITATTFVGDVTGEVLGVAMATIEGSGWAGAASVSSEITKQGKIITTHLFVDIEGLLVSTTESDIIGDTAAANSHAGQFALAESGQFLSGTITCLEAPTTGVADIDFTVSSASTGVENADVDALANAVILLANTEAWTIGMSKAMALLPNATSDYLYLSAGVAGTPGTYDAGQFLIELIGYEA